MNLLRKLVEREPVTDEDLAEELYEVCDRVHATCDDECPVFEKNGGTLNPTAKNRGCACFKNGKAMLEFLRNGE